MGKYSGYLFLSDYDLSLTGMDGTIPQANRDAIDRFMDGGGIFGICTGRSRQMLLGKLDGLTFNAPLVCLNGAMAYDIAADRIVFEHHFPDSIWDYVDGLKKQFPKFNFELQARTDHYAWSMEENRKYLLDMLGVPFHTCPPYGEEPVYLAFCGGPFFKPGHLRDGAATLTPELDRAFEEYIDYVHSTSGYQPVRSLRHICEFMPENVSKGRGARELCEMLGCHTLVTLGDAPNDFDMLKRADIAFMPADGAVEQGKNLRGDLQVTCPCGEGSVAGAIAQL